MSLKLHFPWPKYNYYCTVGVCGKFSWRLLIYDLKNWRIAEEVKAFTNNKFQDQGVLDTKE